MPLSSVLDIRPSHSRPPRRLALSAAFTSDRRLHTAALVVVMLTVVVIVVRVIVVFAGQTFGGSKYKSGPGVFGQFSALRGPGSFGNGSGLKSSAGCAANEPRRPNLRLFRGQIGIVGVGLPGIGLPLSVFLALRHAGDVALELDSQSLVV